MNTAFEDEDDRNHFRVAIFGSARITKGDSNYQLVYDLAKLIAEAGMDVVTGGGSGLMNAASEGHHDGRKDQKTHSVGLRIKLPMEEKEAIHLDIKKEFYRFSSRLDSFMQISNAVVVAPGGVGTMLELFYTWQLLQVKHICNIPIILLGSMWLDLIDWIKKHPLEKELLSLSDLNLLFVAKDCHEAMDIIKKTYEEYKKGNEDFCNNYEKYKT